MDFNRQNNRPAQRATARPIVQAATPASVSSPGVLPSRQTDTRKKHGLKHVLLLTVTALALVVAGYALGNVSPVGKSDEFSRVDTNKNQAVFLSNDQVYFGKITEITDTAIVMKDIYYLQGSAAQSSGTGQQAATPDQQSNNLALTKLGNELHGPEDRMQINRDQVLFWENLKSDGKVSEAIKAFKP